MASSSLKKKLPTAQIVVGSFERPFHTVDDPSEYMVSSVSKWRDFVWHLDCIQGGTANWHFQLPDGSWSTDSRNARLLDAFKRLEWSRYTDPKVGKAMSFSGASSRASVMRQTFRWMNARGHYDLTTLDWEALQQLIDDVVPDLVSDEGTAEFDDELREDTYARALPADFWAELQEDSSMYGRLYRLVAFWQHTWNQCPAVSKFCAVMLRDPLQGRTAYAVTTEYVEKAYELIQPLPDEVAVPILNAAHLWIGLIAEDVIRLHELAMGLLAGAVRVGKYIAISKDEAAELEAFKFSPTKEGGEPWREQFNLAATPHGYVFPSVEIRRLVTAVRNASTIVLSAETGMRPGELSVTPVAVTRQGELCQPYFVKTSHSGLNELFMLDSLLTKERSVPEEEEWLLGARPMGSTFVPGPVRAIEVLIRLLAPWRKLAGDSDAKDYLLVNMDVSPALPTAGARIVPTVVPTICRGQQDFIEQHVDLSQLPDYGSLEESLVEYRESKGRCIVPMQWRKTYAMYVFRTDRRLIPAIAMQFKHLSVATTEASYIGNNPALFRDRESQQARAAASALYKMLRGAEPAAGRILKLIEEHQDSLRALIDGRTGLAAVDSLKYWCEKHGIKAFPGPHGACFIGVAPKESKCNAEAGRAHWSNSKPDFSRRRPDLCAGCKVFGVDSSHGGFWSRRYVENKEFLVKAGKVGLPGGFRVFEMRVQQSENMLNVLGISIPEIKEE